MRSCDCGNEIPNKQYVAGRLRNLRNRTKCLICQPFGTSRYCKNDRKEARRTSARRHYDRFKAKNGIDPIALRRKQRKAFIISSLGGKCPFCGYSACQRNLVFHHLANKDDHLTSREFQREFSVVYAELIKCVMCCHNCHGEIHDGLFKEDRLLTEHERLLSIIRQLEGLTWREIMGPLECPT